MPDAPSAKEMHTSIARFLDDLARRSEPSTVKSYRGALVHLVTFLTRRGGGIRDVTPEVVQEFVDDQLAHRFAPRTVQVRLVAVRTFGAWAVEQRLWTTNHAELVPSLPDSSTPTHTMTMDEVERLVEHGPDPAGPHYNRDRALVLVAARLGLKTGEIQRLNWEHVLVDLGLVHIDGGPRREVRELVLPRDLASALRALAAPAARSGPVFAGRDGRAISDRRLRAMLTAMGERAGLPEVNFDAIRFAHVEEAVNSGTPLATGQDDFGFASASAVLRAAGRFSKERAERLQPDADGCLGHHAAVVDPEAGSDHGDP